MSTRPPYHYEGLDKKFHRTDEVQNRKESHHMRNEHKAALKALALAAAQYLIAVASTLGDEEPAVPAKPATKKKETPVEAPKVEPAKVESKPEPVKHVEKPANGAGDLMAQARTAAKSYAEVYGREGLKAVLKKYTEGTLADVPADKLPELLAELS